MVIELMFPVSETTYSVEFRVPQHKAASETADRTLSRTLNDKMVDSHSPIPATK